MAFERLKNLGEERFGFILNQLMTGKPAMTLAREIQQQWGEFQDVAEKTLTQQLNRLRLVAAEGAFGKKLAKQIEAGHTPQVKALAKVSPQVLERMEELSQIQHTRMLEFVEKEKHMPLPSLRMLEATTAVFVEYKECLKDIQKMRFDLGLDEFKGPLTGAGHLRGASASVTLPDGTNIQKQVYEAVGVVEEILNKRGISPTGK